MQTDKQPKRRGLAMMLVLFSLAMATILATAYLASRDNSALIGDNVAKSASARWAAMSTLEMGIAILQTQTDWRTNHTNGTLLDNYPLAGATVSIVLRDIVTDSPPNADSEYLELTASATVDGLTQTATADVFVSSIPSGSINVDLTEFVIFARNSLTMSNDATVARWPMAPLAAAGRRVAIGTQATSSGSIKLNDNAACIDATLYHRVSASGTLVINNGGGPVIAQVAMASVIPMPNEPAPGESSGGGPNLNLFGTSQTLTADDRFTDINLSNAQLTLQGNITIVVNNDWKLWNSQIIVDGNVKLVVFDDIETYTGSMILVTPGSTLNVWVGDDFWITDSFIGEQGGAGTWDNTGNAPHFNPQAIRVFEMETGEANIWYLRGNSIMKGSIYGTSVQFTVTDSSALYGRVAAAKVILSLDGAIFYDHGIDLRQGFANSNSSVFNDPDTGDIKSAISSLGALNASDLTTLANTLELFVISNGMTYGSGPTTPAPPPPGPNDPTPRDVPVEYSISSFATDVGRWEDEVVSAQGGG